jgi:hypothetical protein
MARGLLVLLCLLGSFLVFGFVMHAEDLQGTLKATGAGVAILVFVASLSLAAVIQGSDRTCAAIRNLDATMTKVLHSINQLQAAFTETGDHEEQSAEEAPSESIIAVPEEPGPTAVKRREEF